MSRSIAALVLVFLCFAWLSADPQSAINGQITDSEGAAIANARVLVHWDSSSPKTARGGLTQDVSAFADSRGMYSATVPTGFYDVFVSAPAFTPIAAKVILRQGQKATLNAKLNVDPLLSKEVGGMGVEGVPPKQ